jgi:hypothetical protein
LELLHHKIIRAQSALIIWLLQQAAVVDHREQAAAVLVVY